MNRVVLISCVSQKLAHKAKTKDLYTSTLFKYNIKYAMSFNPDKIFVLSAKYGLLELEDEIDTYNETLNTKSVKEVKSWSEGIVMSLRRKVNLQEDEFIFLAGEKYRKYLIPEIKNYIVPMEGLSIGKQLKFLKKVAK